MDSTTEGMLIGSHCLLISFLAGIEAKGIFTKDERAHLYDSASLMLAEILPAAMTPEARTFANEYLERLAKQNPPQPD